MTFALLALALGACSVTPSESAAVGSGFPSAACPGAGTSVDRAISVGNGTRTYRIHVPSGTDEQALPVVLVFHGYGGDPADVAGETSMSLKADEEGFLAVYPAALGNPTRWDTSGSADIDFVRAVVGALVDGGCADPARIYATGMSMGGAMTLAIGCRMADEIAAIAPVAAPWGPAWIPSCAPSSPVPLAGFHGVEDPIVPYGGGPIGDAGLDLPPVVGVEEWAGEWADRNGCDPGPAEQSAIGDVQPLVWERCVAPVRLYRIEHAGHSWPGSPLGYPMTNRDISATDLIWDFFVEVSR